MAQNPFPLDQVQTQLTRPTTNVTAPSVAGPQPTGLSQGMAVFGKALGSAAEFAKARRFKQDMKDAALAAAKGEVAPGLVSEEAVEHNFKVLDENYVNDILDQLKVHGSTHISHLANDGSKTSIQKSDEIEGFLDNVIGHGLQTVTHNGEALGKLQLGVESYKRSWLQDVAQYEKQVLTQANIKNVIDNTKQAIDIIPASRRVEGIYTRSGFYGQSQGLENAQLQHPFINVNGKLIKATIGLDTKKAVFQVYGDLLLERYENNPVQFGSLVQEYKAFVREVIDPLIKKENSIITSGKSDAIGDDATFQSIKDKVFTELNEANKRIDKQTKDGHSTWVARFAREIVAKGDPNKTGTTRQLKLNSSERAQVEQRFPELRDSQREITAIEKYLAHHKYGVESKVYKGLRSAIIRRRVDNRDRIEREIYRKAIDPELTTRLTSIMTENREAIVYNIDQLEKFTPTLTFGKILDSVENVMLKKHIEEGLEYYKIKRDLVIRFPTLEKLVNRISKLEASTEHLEPLLKAQDIYNTLATMTEDRAVEIAERSYRPRIEKTKDDRTTWVEDETQRTNSEPRIIQKQRMEFNDEVMSMYKELIASFANVKKKETQ